MNGETVACDKPMSVMEGTVDRMESAVARAEALNARLIEIVFAKVVEPPKNPALAETTLTDIISNKGDRLQLVNDRTEYICGVLSELLGSIKLREEC